MDEAMTDSSTQGGDQEDEETEDEPTEDEAEVVEFEHKVRTDPPVRVRGRLRLATRVAWIGLMLIGFCAMSQPARAANPTLSLDPAEGSESSTLSATYADDMDPRETCSSGIVDFWWDAAGGGSNVPDAQKLGSAQIETSNCEATARLVVPQASCGQHSVYAFRSKDGDPEPGSSANAAFTVAECTTPSPVSSPSPTPKSPSAAAPVQPSESASPSRTLGSTIAEGDTNGPGSPLRTKSAGPGWAGILTLIVVGLVPFGAWLAANVLKFGPMAKGTTRRWASLALAASASAGLVWVASFQVGGFGHAKPGSARPPCDQAAQLDEAGNVIFPNEATDTEQPVDVDEDLGSLAALYPDLDTTTDAFYPLLPCEPSIGGTLPPDEPPTQDDLLAEEYLNHFETEQGAEILEQLRSHPKPAISLLDPFTLGDCFIRPKKVSCDDPAFLDSSMPFEGRDIIYVHGLETQDLFDRIKDPTGPASKEWPQNTSEFLSPSGYFRVSAENYWRPHIVENLSSQDPTFSTAGWQWTPSDNDPAYKPKANRYLLIAWSSDQTIEYAQHTMLTQIQLAMTSNKNVFTPPTYPASHVRPFCANGCIVIGHSTGPLITSSAMGLAQSGHFGPGGKEIARHIVAHVSFDGAISGSRIASAAMAVASLGAPVAAASNVLCPIVDALFGLNSACNADLSFVKHSILRDLMPVIAQGVWGREVDRSPVPTVTVAGGHPTGNQAGGLTQFILPGVDDGVVTMNSACGNPNPVFPSVTPPSGLTASSLLKAFEFSGNAARFTRGAKVLVSQKNLMTGLPYLGTSPGVRYLAGACMPYLSASGMVMPVVNAWGGTSFDSRKRYKNHYSFIQGLAEHSYDGGTHAPNIWPSLFAAAPTALREYKPFPVSGINLEESRVVTDASIYSRMLDANGTHLVKPLDMHVIVRGRKVSFHMPFNLGKCTKQGTLKWYCSKWIWKRTYHLADKWEKKQSSHYVYEYVGRR